MKGKDTAGQNWQEAEGRTTIPTDFQLKVSLPLLGDTGVIYFTWALTFPGWPEAALMRQRHM